MEYANLGKSGLKVSKLCLGMMTYGSSRWRDWVLDEDDSRPFIQQAVESGINFFDTANAYSMGVSEEVTGKLLREFTNRDEVVVATKVYFPMKEIPNCGGLSRKHIMDSIDASLKRLGMDYVDLFQIHRWDYETPIEETMEALHDVVKAGKARYIGASSMYAWQFAEAQHTTDLHGWTRFVSMQNHMNAIYREEEREMVPLCVDQGVGIIPWSPMARGFLAGNRHSKGEGPTKRSRSDVYAHSMYYESSDFDVLAAVENVAGKLGVKPAQVALSWLLHKPGITSPIIGASKLHHLEDAVAAVELQLSDEDMAAIEAPYRPHPILGHS